ncbi:MAG: tyrosine-type recombinase/integrase [Pseudomonadota bacterium]
MGVWKKQATGRWAAQFRHKLKRYKKEGFKSRKEAIQWEAKKRQEVEAPAIAIPTHSYQQVSTDYISDCKTRMQKNTWRQKIFIHRSFLAFIGKDISIDSVTLHIITAYLMTRLMDKGAKCANRDLRELKAIFNWALKRDYVNHKNPCDVIEKWPEEKYTPYVPPIDDFNKILDVADKNERDLLLTIFLTLGRKSEVANRLEKEHIAFDEKQITLFTRKRKGGELQADQVPLSPKLSEKLIKRLAEMNTKGERVFNFTEYELKVMMKKLCGQAEVKPFGFHAIRHLAASIMNRSNKTSTKQIQTLLRHQRQSTTEIYLHLTDESLSDAITVLDEEI